MFWECFVIYLYVMIALGCFLADCDSKRSSSFSNFVLSFFWPLAIGIRINKL